MATTKARKPRVAKVYADEQALEAKIAAIAERAKKANDRALTDPEKKETAELRKQLGALRFVRLADQRGGKAIAALRNLAKLTGRSYTRTPEQVEKITATLTAEVKAVAHALAPTAATAAKEADKFTFGL